MTSKLWIPEDIKEERSIKTITRNSLYGESSGGFGFVDSYNNTRAPGKAQLLKDFEDVVETCAKHNAEVVSSNPFRLYSATNKKTKRWKTKRLSHQQKSFVGKYFSIDDSEAEEVVDYNHPFNRLKQKPNSEHSWKDLLNITDLSLEVFGTSYWYVPLNALGLPQEIWILQTDRVTPKCDDDGRLVSVEYKTKNGKSETYTLDNPKYKIIRFVFTNLGTIYGEGRSPLRSIWEQRTIANKIMAHEGTLLDNQGRPDIVVSFAEGMGPAEEEYAKQEWAMKNKFRKQAGGIAFADGATITPLTFPPKDMFMIEFFNLTKTQIANAYGVPMAFLETKDVNRANLEAARDLHAKSAVLPRCCNLQNVINQQLISLFDDSGKLFGAFDDPCPENIEQKILQEKAQAEIDNLRVGKIVTANEIRERDGLEAREDGDELVAANPSAVTVNTGSSEIEDEPTATTETVEEQAEQEIQTLPSQTLNGAQITSATMIVSQVAMGALPRDSGLGQLQVLLNLSKEQAEQIMGSVGNGFVPASPEPEPQQEQESKFYIPESYETKAKPKQVPKKPNEKLVKILKKHYAKWHSDIKENLTKGIKAKAKLPKKFVPVTEWKTSLSHEVKPILEIMYSDSGKQIMQRVGASPSAFEVSNPLVIKYAKKAALDLAESTLATTSQKVNDALDATRAALADGLEEGESVAKLTQRINDIFENASEDRSMLIAKTETARAYNMGAIGAAKESGVVSGFKSLPSSNPCPICDELANKTFSLDDDGPPYHPACECSVEMVLSNDDEEE